MKDTSLVLLRSNYERQTLGNLIVLKDTDVLFNCKTVELPKGMNTPRKECIPAGVYDVIEHHSPKHGKCFWIIKVPGREEVLIHSANYSSQLLGCIAPGMAHTDINKDGLRDVTSSVTTMETLLKLLPERFKLIIIDLP